MTVIYCPVCNKRVCDSNKRPIIAKLSKSNEQKADIVIKCNNCKNRLAVKIPRNHVGTNGEESL